MTAQQQKLLRFIERYQAEHDGVSPSFEEMRAALSLAAKSDIDRLLSALERQGRVRRGKHQVRAIEIVGLPALLVSVTDEALLAEVARRGLNRVPA